MTFTFQGEAIYWRGPAPFVFVPAPPDVAAEIKAASKNLTYGWGCIPATVTIGETTITTALFPKENTYYVPIKVALQKAEEIDVGTQVLLTLELAPSNL